MNHMTNRSDEPGHRPERWLWRTGSLLAIIVIGFALCTVVCACSLPLMGGQLTPSSSPTAGTRSTSKITVAFAECMRSHGVKNFPNPTDNSSPLAPGSSIDPTSPQFQQALEACKSLAPPGWISSGPSSGAPGGP